MASCRCRRLVRSGPGGDPGVRWGERRREPQRVLRQLRVRAGLPVRRTHRPRSPGCPRRARLDRREQTRPPDRGHRPPWRPRPAAADRPHLHPDGGHGGAPQSGCGRGILRRQPHGDHPQRPRQPALVGRGPRGPRRGDQEHPVCRARVLPSTGVTSRPGARLRHPAPAPPAAGGVDCAALKCVALTFDDGPGAHTSRLLTSLDAAGVKATFFVLGQNVAVNPAVIKRMAASGHVVANHTWDHRDLKKLSGADITSEVTRTNQAITAATGSGTTLLRPPYGSFGQPVRGLGQAIIMWDIDTLDWKFRNVDEVITRGMTGVKAGSIILMHDIHATTVDAVPGLIAKLKAAGFTLVTVPQLLGSPTPGTVYYSQSRTG
ncbi:MAG: polysaccharide deacetylase family protein [Dermatophilaceae bacterium]